ncbi:MAG: chorismate-binding protein, partial [Chloroflexi bacterium]|nr:chorismate-binding protein [Chloroflexota bacterium]
EAIRRLEGDRGWYGAPVGWVDAMGEGELWVGIRSALVRGDRAVLFAGAGIVDGSEPSREFAETEMKFQPLLKALGHDEHSF